MAYTDCLLLKIIGIGRYIPPSVHAWMPPLFSVPSHTKISKKESHVLSVITFLIQKNRNKHKVHCVFHCRYRFSASDLSVASKMFKLRNKSPNIYSACGQGHNTSICDHARMSKLLNKIRQRRLTSTSKNQVLTLSRIINPHNLPQALTA